ncbi:uncharacterized protein LOC131178408 [Hevea brasiliensis]|uniref:uncharacterized protein LOC131178408 n=1 Tax=Hevea brasiliensis TaxID=3981 RepID=UPI0025E9DF10|nr:uncharacterized protein LOC131178408 [Hevea brasiliensis]
MTRKAVKGSVIADLLAQNPIEEYEALDFEFPYEYINTVEGELGEQSDVWQMYFDGAINVSGSGIELVLVSPYGKHFPIAVKLKFECTNNVAEYKACVSGLQVAIKMKIKKLEVYGDSALIIYQVKGEWQTQDLKLIPHGLPDKLITDNAKNLNGSKVKELCDQYKIHHLNSSPYQSQMNGAVDAANKNLKKIIEKMTITYKDWHEVLPFALHAYRTTVRTSTGATSYSLVYGMEAVSPIEVEIPSLRILAEAELDDME